MIYSLLIMNLPYAYKMIGVYAGATSPNRDLPVTHAARKLSQPPRKPSAAHPERLAFVANPLTIKALGMACPNLVVLPEALRFVQVQEISAN